MKKSVKNLLFYTAVVLSSAFVADAVASRATEQASVAHMSEEGGAYVRLEYDENYEIVDTVSGNAADVKDALLLEITALLSSLSVEDFEYEVLLGEYTYVGESDAFSELTFSLDEEGNLSTVYILGNDEQITAYWFYDYGTTELE